MISNSFYPDWDYGPSDIIKTFIDIKNIKIDTLNTEQKIVIEDLLKNSSAPTGESMQILSEVFNCDTVFWENIYKQYERNIIRLKETEIDENYTEFSGLLKELTKNDWLAKTKFKSINQANLKAFFNIPSYQPLDYDDILENTIGLARFKRISDYASSGLNLASLVQKAEWEIKKQNITANWNPQVFSENLQKIKLLTKKKGIDKFSRELNELCNVAGVGLVFLETLPKTPIRGISKFTSDGKALIVITTKYNKDYIFWQTFFHEAAHLILHADQKIHFDAEEEGIPSLTDPIEIEADDFMINELLHPLKLSEVVEKIDFELMKKDKLGSWRNIASVAEESQISPSLLTGLLKREAKIPYSYFNKSHKAVFN